MATLNLAIHGIDADLGRFNADTFFDDWNNDKIFDFAMSSPPFNLSDWGGDKLKQDPRWQYGIPLEGNINSAQMQHMIHQLNGTGRIGTALADASFSSRTSDGDDIRRRMVAADPIECELC